MATSLYIQIAWKRTVHTPGSGWICSRRGCRPIHRPLHRIKMGVFRLNCMAKSRERVILIFDRVGWRSIVRQAAFAADVRLMLDRLTGPDVVSLSREHTRLCQLTMGGLSV